MGLAGCTELWVVGHNYQSGLFFTAQGIYCLWCFLVGFLAGTTSDFCWAPQTLDFRTQEAPTPNRVVREGRVLA